MGTFIDWITGRAATPALSESTRQRAATPDGVMPPSRQPGQRPVSVSEAVTLVAVYRALDILETAAGQLSLDSRRNGQPLTGQQVPPIVRKPDPNMDRGEFVEQAVLSMAVAGNAYARIRRAGDSSVIALELMNPHEMGVEVTQMGRRKYSYRGEQLAQSEVMHLAKLKLPGQAKGLGPIQAARAELAGSLNTRDYSATWFDGSGQPAGLLKTEQPLTPDDAKQYRNQWNGLDTDGNPEDQAKNPSGVKVLGKGVDYKPIMLKPSDAQWLESQQFNTTQVARLFGVPASLMLAAVEGNAQTYANVEQDWIAFTRFTLMGYLRKIEAGLTELVPHGQQVRFNVEALLRTDTKTRYESHAIALGRWATADEIRDIEGMAPLTTGQRAELAETTAPPMKSKENA